MKSLAEALGLDSPKPDEPTSKKKLTIKQFCKLVLESEEYRRSVLQRVTLGTLPPAIETLIFHYAEGKPVEKMEIKDKTNPLDGMSLEQLEKRAEHLAALAAKLRGAQEDTTVVH